MSEVEYEITSPIEANILSIAKTLRTGDRITIWKDLYQVHIEGMGTSNFIINNDLEKKEKKALTKQA